MSDGTEKNERPLRADAQRNRELILKAAGEVFAEHGLDSSLDQIAAHAGLGVGTVYRRFPDKNALIDELFKVRLGEFVDVAEECAAMEDAWIGLTTFIARGSVLQGKNSGLRDLLMGPGLTRELMNEPRSRLAPLVGSMVDRAKASGQLRPDFEVLDVPIAEMMLARIIDITGPEAPDVWQRHFTMLIDGMRAEGATPLPVPGLTPEQYSTALLRKRA